MINCDSHTDYQGHDICSDGRDICIRDGDNHKYDSHE